jgi:hypothetical protein
MGASHMPSLLPSLANYFPLEITDFYHTGASRLLLGSTGICLNVERPAQIVAKKLIELARRRQNLFAKERAHVI